MSTPHIAAKPGDFAQTCLFPGDPLRAKWAAENFLQDIRQINTVRNMFGYTGMYKDTPVSIMGSGMGIPSSLIYAHELITKFEVKNIIRTGSCGGIAKNIKLGDTIIANGAGTDSNCNRMRFEGGDFPAVPNFHLLRTAVETAEKLGKAPHVGSIYSTDLFYHPNEKLTDSLLNMGFLGIEMEAAGLYGLAAEHGVSALAICGVSDHLLTGEQATPEEREQGFGEMIKIGLETAIAI